MVRVWEGDVGSLTPELLSGRTGVDVVLRTDVSVCVVCKHDGVCGKYSIFDRSLSVFTSYCSPLSINIVTFSVCVYNQQTVHLSQSTLSNKDGE